MATQTNKRTNEGTDSIESALKARFPTVEAYQYKSFAIRVRVVDKRFLGKSNPERHAMIEPLLGTLSDDVRDRITMLLLLAPGEEGVSLLNQEFEDPTPSDL